MLLSVEMKQFFDKVARKNFRLACDVYYALKSGQEVTPEIRSMVRQALLLGA